MSNIMSLVDVMDSHRETIGASIGDAFCAHTSKGTTRCGWTEDRARTVDGCASSNASRSEWEAILKKEGI